MRKNTEQQNIKMSRTVIVNFKIVYKIESLCAIRGKRIYKTTWTPAINEKLDWKKDD